MNINGKNIRPRDEDFDLESMIPRKVAEKKGTGFPERKAGPVLILLAIAVVVTFIGVLIFNTAKKNQHTVLNTVTTNALP